MKLSRKLLLIGALGIAALSAGLLAQSTPGVHPVTGRHIAGTCGGGPCASWLERPEREQEENPDAAIDALKLKSGMVVADVGAGTGFMSMKMARKVGPSGKVYAEDVQPEMLAAIRTNITRAKLSNVETVQGTFTDPLLPAGKLDLVLLVDVYHEFTEPQKMIDGIRASLKPDGRLVLLEYRKEDPSIPIQELHKMSVAEVKAEIEPQGFKLQPVIETLPRQHILILTKTK